jgi:ABC-2 type transport system ATP-binding protein
MPAPRSRLPRAEEGAELPLVAAEALAKRYGRTWALRDVDFELADGSVTALVGPNGAGKSTFIKLCLGFEAATRGRVLVGGSDPARDRAGALGRIGYVPQTPTLYRELSAIDHLRLAASLRPGFDLPYGKQRLEDLDIPLESRPGQLSGGQAAQLWLAVALGTRAPVLLLDEPLANLDPLARREFLQVVAHAAATDGVTILLSSHVIWDVEPIADRLLLLAGGRVLIDDTVEAACRSHRVIRAGAAGSGSGAGDETAPGERISPFPDRDGASLELRRVPANSPGSAASLEDVVMGYLASARHPRTAPAPASAGAGSPTGIGA